MNASSDTPPLAIHDLLDPTVWPHATTNLDMIETHISWVILTGQFAYKIKKPIDLGFVDYKSLQRRKHFCDLEVELNRRFAPDLYLGVVPIRKTRNGLRVGQINDNSESEGLIIEYAVKMGQFQQSQIAACHLTQSDLSARMVEDFGKSLANSHSKIESGIPTLEMIQPKRIAADAMDNFSVLDEFFDTDVRSKLLGDEF